MDKKRTVLRAAFWYYFDWLVFLLGNILFSVFVLACVLMVALTLGDKVHPWIYGWVAIMAIPSIFKFGDWSLDFWSWWYHRGYLDEEDKNLLGLAAKKAENMALTLNRG